MPEFTLPDYKNTTRKVEIAKDTGNVSDKELEEMIKQSKQELPAAKRKAIIRQPTKTREKRGSGTH